MLREIQAHGNFKEISLCGVVDSHLFKSILFTFLYDNITLRRSKGIVERYHRRTSNDQSLAEVECFSTIIQRPLAKWRRFSKKTIRSVT